MQTFTVELRGFGHHVIEKVDAESVESAIAIVEQRYGVSKQIVNRESEPVGVSARTRYAKVSGFEGNVNDPKAWRAAEQYVESLLIGEYSVARDALVDPFYADAIEVLIEGDDSGDRTLGSVLAKLSTLGLVAREQFVHIEDVGDAESGPSVSTWLEDHPQTKGA